MEIFELILSITNFIISATLFFVIVKYIGKSNGKK